MKLLLVVLIVLVAIVAATIIIPDTGTIQTQVVDQDTHQALEGVEVVIEGEDYWFQGQTDTSGLVTVNGVPDGAYRLQLREAGYMRLDTAVVQVKTMRTTALDLELARKIHGCY